MMPLDSWIDEDALAMMRALSPKHPPTPDAGPDVDPRFDFGLDPESPLPAGMPEAPAPRIARSGDPEPGAIDRMRQRLAEIRRRAESGGIVRAGRASISPSQAVPPPEPIAPAPAIPDDIPPAAPAASADLPASPPMPDAAPEPVVATPAPAPAVDASAPVPAVDAPALTPAVDSDFPASVVDVAVPDSGFATPIGEAAPEPLPPAPDAIPAEARAPESAEPVWPRQPGPLDVPEGPLAVRLDAFRRWLAAECGVAQPVVFDRHGCPLHAADGQNALIAAAVSLGTAWREACALTDPPGTLRAVHSAWGGGTMAVIPVPTRFGDLYIAGLVQAAIEPSLAATIGAALRRAAGV